MLKARRMGDVIPIRRAPTQPSQLSDEALVAACALGDASAIPAFSDAASLASLRSQLGLLLRAPLGGGGDAAPSR